MLTRLKSNQFPYLRKILLRREDAKLFRQLLLHEINFCYERAIKNDAVNRFKVLYLQQVLLTLPSLY
jgi:hypothetical protein